MFPHSENHDAKTIRHWKWKRHWNTDGRRRSKCYSQCFWRSSFHQLSPLASIPDHGNNPGCPGVIHTRLGMQSSTVTQEHFDDWKWKNIMWWLLELIWMKFCADLRLTMKLEIMSSNFASYFNCISFFVQYIINCEKFAVCYQELWSGLKSSVTNCEIVWSMSLGNVKWFEVCP